MFLLFQFSSLIIFILFGPAHATIMKYSVPYDWLATRTPILKMSMERGFSTTMVSEFDAACKNRTCFASVYTDPATSIEMFQLLSNEQNDCRVLPNCLDFSKSSYQYSIIFFKSDMLQNETCLEKLDLIELFKLPSCPEDWFSFTRANGRKWCWMIEPKTLKTQRAARDYCYGFKAELNGFDSNEERNAFIASVHSMEASTSFYKRWIYLGARRNLDCALNKTCVYQNPVILSSDMYWYNVISNNLTLANDIPFLPYWDGSGVCLSYYRDEEKYDDMACDSESSYTCGKYADIYDD